MSKPVKRKLSAFPCLISHAQAEQDEALFDFDAPTFADLTTLIQNPPHCPDILNVAINPKNRDDYWFTYSHYQHEEDEESTDATKLSKRTSSIHGVLHTNTNNAKQNEATTKHHPLETAKKVEPVHKDEKKTSKQVQNDHLKSNKKRFTMNTSKAQDFSFAASKNLIGDKPGALDFGIAAVQKRVLNVRPNEPAAQPQKKEVAQNNVDPGKRTLKRKGITSSNDVNLNDMRLIQGKPANTTTSTASTARNNPNAIQIEDSTNRPEPVLKKVKGNMSPHRDEKKNEKVKIEIRSPMMNKSVTTMSSTVREMGTTDLVRAVQQATREKNERDARMRRSVSVATVRPLQVARNNSKENPVVDKNLMDEEGKKSKRREESVVSLREEKGTNTTNHNIKIVYEPAKYSARDVRKWEKESGKSWYKLTFQERHQANLDIEKMINDAKKV